MRKLTKTQRLTTCTARKPTLASHTFQNLKAFEKSTMLWYTPRRDYGSQKEESLSEGPTGERVQEGNKILIGALYSAQTSYQPSCPDQLFDQFCKIPLFACFGLGSTYPGNITLFKYFLIKKKHEL